VNCDMTYTTFCTKMKNWELNSDRMKYAKGTMRELMKDMDNRMMFDIVRSDNFAENYIRRARECKGS